MSQPATLIYTTPSPDQSVTCLICLERVDKGAVRLSCCPDALMCSDCIGHWLTHLTLHEKQTKCICRTPVDASERKPLIYENPWESPGEETYEYYEEEYDYEEGSLYNDENHNSDEGQEVRVEENFWERIRSTPTAQNLSDADGEYDLIDQSGEDVVISETEVDSEIEGESEEFGLHQPGAPLCTLSDGYAMMHDDHFQFREPARFAASFTALNMSIYDPPPYHTGTIIIPDTFSVDYGTEVETMMDYLDYSSDHEGEDHF
ncbi:hypothetical protein BJ878DRAFT_97440 [Calycina marina]|uniref:RING-type domain-containing protein n=1 Tax=Calycina marina TaxID=1763456 RepID=A0A9P7Z203_9HELO|nr:hypothetical protein BJ878DRAFT_97440 [Calycina marina]